MANVLQFTVNFFRDFEAPLDGVIVGPEKVNKISALLGTANPVGMHLNVWAREGSAFVYRIKINNLNDFSFWFINLHKASFLCVCN